MIALWATDAIQLYDNWHTATSRRDSVVNHAGIAALDEFQFNLQAERALSAADLADPAAFQSQLAQQRARTDASVSAVQALSATATPDIASALNQIDGQMRRLPGYRSAVDQANATQEQVFDYYTGILTADIDVFAALTKTGVSALDVTTEQSMSQVWAQEMISRENAIMTAGIGSGHLTIEQRSELDQFVGTELFIYQNEVIPDFPGSVSAVYQKMLDSDVWQQKTQIEETLDNTPFNADGLVVVPTALAQQWQQTLTSLGSQLQNAQQVETGYILATGDSAINTMKNRLIYTTILGAAGVLLVIALTWWLTGVLRRRIFALRTAALDVQNRLPDIVERLRLGEDVDTDAELPEIKYGGDELGMLGRALNSARGSALDTAVRQIEQYRGFERLLQRIARRTQLLIGLQVKKINEMERRHEDPDLLEGLFDLDHLTARLRRYEENLVILGGGQPQRRWRKPVPLLDVLRSAQGEVQDYRRIRIEIESRTWVSERAVGPMVHVLAELMENAVAFSKPPTPVEVTAARVGRGLAIEIEDRGMGMDPEQYDQANELMRNPPKMDVVSRAEDVRLGMYVVARLAFGLGLRVEFRPSPYGGTRVVVLVPDELVFDAEHDSFDGAGAEEAEEPAAPRLAPVDVIRVERADEIPEPVPFAARTETPAPTLVGAPTPVGGVKPEITEAPKLAPLPRRVRMASLAAELRDPSRRDQQRTETPEPPVASPTRAGATIGAFQRQSRIARFGPGVDHQDPHPGQEQTRKEDGQ